MAAITVDMQTLTVDDPSVISASDHLAEALHNQACLSCIFSFLEDDKALLRASAVCKLWLVVIQSESIWQAVYRHLLPEPMAHERVRSYRQQFKRLRGLLDLQPPQPTLLKGAAVCYNPASGNLVSYNARQRMLSVQSADGQVRSQVVNVQGDGTAHKPLLASSGSGIVVLAAFDGALQLWDAGQCQPLCVLGSHQSFITSLDASGSLVASACSSELRLWDLDSRQCLYQVAIGLPMPSPVLEPHVAVCHNQQLLALANCAAPAPSSVVKVYSTRPASNKHSRSKDSSTSTTEDLAAGDHQQTGVQVGSSSIPGAAGALLVRELPVNAAADLMLQQGLLLVASCFHGRSVSNNTPYKSERPFTVVVHIWETRHWQLTRLISPRLWTDYPIMAMQGMPLISLTQGMLLCATLRTGVTHAPSCSIHAWQLPEHLLKVQRNLDDVTGSRSNQQEQYGDSGVDSSLCLLSVSPSKQVGSSSAAGAASSSGRSSTMQPEPYGQGCMALGRAAVTAAGGAGSCGVSASHTVMLAVTDTDRSDWLPLLDDTHGVLTAMLTTPDQLVLATEQGQVLSSRLLPVDAVEQSEQQQAQQSCVAGSSSVPTHVHVADGSGSWLDVDLV